jgi:hypothetical protein
MTCLKPILSLYRCTIPRILFGILFVFGWGLLHSQQLPIGYIPYYSQRGNNPDLIKSLVINQPNGFEAGKDKSSIMLSPFHEGSAGISLPPICRGIIADKIFGEFIIEFEYKLKAGVISNLSGFYFLAPVKSNTTYYAIAFSDDSLSFLFFNEGKVVTMNSASGCKMNTGWNKVRIERDILTRSLLVIMNGDTNHRITFTDRNLVMGFVGFGTQGISSFLKNINIWAPTAFTDTLYKGE